MPARLSRLAVLLLSLLLLPPVHADTFTGKVVRILDGDTVEVLVDRTPRRVRLAGIDAPEKAQPFGARAKQSSPSWLRVKLSRSTGTRPTGTAAPWASSPPKEGT